MKRASIWAAAAVMLFAAASARAEDFYIVRDPLGQCHVIRDRPMDMAFVVVTDTAFTTEENALGVMGTVCAKH